MVKRPASSMAGGPSVNTMLQADIEALIKKYEDVMMPADVAGKLAQAAQLTYETLVMRDKIRAHTSVVSGDPADRSLDNQSARIAEAARVTSIHRAETSTSFLIDACVQIGLLQLRFHYSTRMMNKPAASFEQLLAEPCTRVDFSIVGTNGLQPAVQLIQATIYGRGTTPSTEKIPLVVEDDTDEESNTEQHEDERAMEHEVHDALNASENDNSVSVEKEDGTSLDATGPDVVSVSASLDALVYLCEILAVEPDPQAMVYFLMSFPFIDDAWDVPEVVLAAICGDEDEDEDDEDGWEDVDEEDEEGDDDA